MGVQSYSTTASDNNDSPPNGAPENMAPSAVNDTIRQIMADIRSWYESAEWIDLGDAPTRVSDTEFSVSGDQTAVYTENRRVKVVGGSTNYGSITASSYSSPNTTVTVTWDSGATPTGLTSVSVGILNPSNSSLPSTTDEETTGSFTGTLTGFGSNPTGTVSYAKRGNTVTLWMDDAEIIGTSNATTMTMTGLPAAVRPASAVQAFCPLRNNSNSLRFGKAIISASGATITFMLQDSDFFSASNFTASNSKGITAGWSITYRVD